MQGLATYDSRQELAHRSNDGVDVFLLWDRPSNAVAVAVFDTKAGEAFELAIDGREALDAFAHPFAYAAQRGIDYGEPALAPAGGAVHA